ncbi:MAG: hypothetical protein LBD10_04355, partial [Desulfobulbus sp.]|uniref:DnaA N-terminal domain-containing protein n=1 Tax=Desulfobulbus sp. TaxID=895 RepID=UPI002849AC03
METISIGYGKFRTPDWIDGIKMRPGVQKTYEYLAMASRGADHAYPSLDWLAKKVKVTSRSIRNYLRFLIEIGLVEAKRERIKGRLRKVFYFLAHPAIAETNRKNFPVTAEECSDHLTKRKCCTKNPPYPPQGEAAVAAGESYEPTQNQTPTSPEMGEGDLQRSDQSGGGHPGPSESGNEDAHLPHPAAEPLAAIPPEVHAMWTNIKESLRDSLGASAFSLWIEPIRCQDVTDASVLLTCPDKFFAVHVARHFLAAIEEAASSTVGRPLKADLHTQPQN